MQGRFPKGILFVLTNCKDPAQEADFNEWYNTVHLPDVVATGLVANPTRYRNLAPTPEPGMARYLAIYETDREDLREVLKGVGARMPDWQSAGRIHPALEVVLATGYRWTGRAFRTQRTGAPVRGLLVVMTRCKDPAREEEFNRWYDEVHVPDILGTGLYHTAYRFTNATPRAGGGPYLALYETDRDPAEADRLLREEWRPRWQERGRYSPLLEITGRMVCEKVWPR